MSSTINSQTTLDEVNQAHTIAALFALMIRTRFSTRVVDIRLCGSAARGDWSEGSDIDVLVVLDEVGKEDADWLIHTAFQLGVMQHGVLIQPLFISAMDFHELRDRELLLAQDIDREGISL